MSHVNFKVKAILAFVLYGYNVSFWVFSDFNFTIHLKDYLFLILWVDRCQSIDHPIPLILFPQPDIVNIEIENQKSLISVGSLVNFNENISGWIWIVFVLLHVEVVPVVELDWNLSRSGLVIKNCHVLYALLIYYMPWWYSKRFGIWLHGPVAWIWSSQQFLIQRDLLLLSPYQ